MQKYTVNVDTGWRLEEFQSPIPCGESFEAEETPALADGVKRGYLIAEAPEAPAASEPTSERTPAPKKSRVVAASEPPSDLGVSVPLLITNAMRADLKAKGHSEADIDAMTPQEAHAALST